MNAAQAFHKTYRRGEEMSGKARNGWLDERHRCFRVEGWDGCGCAAYAYQMYVVSRSLIRRQSHLEYKRAYNIITARE